jgi:uncharacterized protein (TIGR01777 family)
MKVLITGGSGLIGNRITQLLLEKGIEVAHLTRHRNSKSGVKTYEWDWEKGTIDLKCFEEVTHIIHLAGAGIAEKAWTTKRKRFLIRSRVHTTRLLFKHIDALDKLENFISASGIGYYGARTTEEIFTAASEPHDDFIAKCCIQWENSADLFKPFARVVKLRTGIVLDKENGALPKMSSSIKLGLGAPLGNGEQYMPWIHIDDIANLYIYALTNEMNGAYNAVSGQHAANKEFTYEIAAQLNRKIRIKKVPSFILKTIYGEMADILLKGSRVDNEGLLKSGFKFSYPDLKSALQNIFR